MVPYGPLWSPMITYSTPWSLMVPYGPKWSRMVPYWAVCWDMIPYGPVWHSYSAGTIKYPPREEFYSTISLTVGLLLMIYLRITNNDRWSKYCVKNVTSGKLISTIPHTGGIFTTNAVKNWSNWSHGSWLDISLVWLLYLIKCFTPRCCFLKKS